MHANASTAPSCANTPDTDRAQISDDIIRDFALSSPKRQTLILALIEAYCCDEIETIEAILEHPETTEEEATIIRPTLDTIRESLAASRFQPVFTKDQLEQAETDLHPQRNARRRMGLVVLSLTEKRLQYTAERHQPEFMGLVDVVSEFVTDSKQQLELAESAMARLLLIGGEAMGVSA